MQPDRPAMPPPAGRPGATPGDLLAGSATGSIYDLGYRRYTGVRLGRLNAFLVLFGQSLRWTFGIGRGGRAKIVPFALAAISMLPAVITVSARALVGEGISRIPAGLPSPDGYVSAIATFLIFFVIVQAPELLGRDQRNGTLTLYFSRSIGRLEYALAKWLALAVALALIILAPQLLLFLGTVFTSIDITTGLGNGLPTVMPALASAAACAALMAGVALAIAAFTPRRAYASGAIFAVLLVLGGIVQVLVVRGTGGAWRAIALLDVTALIDGFETFAFGRDPGTIVLRSDLPSAAYAGVTLAIAAISLGVLVLRYRRISA